MLNRQLDSLEKDGEAEVSIGDRPFKIDQEFVEDFSKTDLLYHTKNLKKPLLIMHSPQDKIVKADHAYNLFVAAYHAKSFVSQDGAYHLLTKKKIVCILVM